MGLAPGAIEGADRRTPIGKLLRRLSLDELPQFINVLAGDMSLVGSRLERANYASASQTYIYRYTDRRRVKPGLTGWAQVQGLRGQTSLSDRVEWDNYYIENWSLSAPAFAVARVSRADAMRGSLCPSAVRAAAASASTWWLLRMRRSTAATMGDTAARSGRDESRDLNNSPAWFLTPRRNSAATGRHSPAPSKPKSATSP